MNEAVDLTARYASRVARGATLLDEVLHGWAHRIHRDALDMGSCQRCVLGHLYGDFDEGTYALGLGAGEPVAYGFEFDAEHEHTAAEDDESGCPVYRTLDTLWLAEVEQRLSGPVPS